MTARHKHKKKKQAIRKPSFYDDFHPAQTQSTSAGKLFAKKHAQYQLLSIEELLALFQKNGLSLRKDELLKEYEQCFSLNDLKERYEEHYKDIWTARQEGAQPAADIDAFCALMEKIIAEAYPRESSYDPYYIYIDAKKIMDSSMKIAQAVSSVFGIIDRLLVMKQKNPAASLSVFQTKFGFDLPSFLIRLYVQYAADLPSLADVKQEEERVQRLLDAYEDHASYGADLRAAILCCYASTGDRASIDRKKQELLYLYPQEPYFVYYALLHGIAASRHPLLVKPYYEEAIKYMVLSQGEQTFKDQITLIYKAYEQYEKGAFQ